MQALNITILGIIAVSLDVGFVNVILMQVEGVCIPILTLKSPDAKYQFDVPLNPQISIKADATSFH